jgi:hypothetical protein
MFSVEPRRGGRRRFPMLRIVIVYAQWSFVPTGIETDVDTFVMLPEALF